MVGPRRRDASGVEEQPVQPVLASWERRLGIIKRGVLTCLEEYKAAVDQPGAQQAQNKLKILNNRFIEETRTCMDKLTDVQVDEYTSLQLEAELLTAADHRDRPRQPETSEAKLPRLELIKFNGNMLKWREFWDRFVSSVHSKNMTNADKLSYLQASLIGEARDAISGIEATNENYLVAIQLLKDRFGKPGLVIDAHYNALNSIKVASNTAKDCLDTYNSIEKHLRVLESMGENVNGNHLRSLIVNKYPEQIIQELKTKLKIEDSSVEEIRKGLEHIILAKTPSTEAKIPIMTVETLNVQEKKKFMRISKGKRKARDTSCLATPLNKKRRLLPCVFCGGEHFNSNCKTVVGLEERKKKIAGRCFICFKNDHRARDCKTRRKCFYCGEVGKHNSALCNVRKNSTFQASNSRSGTVLQTAITYIRSTDGSEHKCRLILDTGSQRSYATKNLIKLVKPNIIEKDYLMVFTFGQETPKKFESSRATIRLICRSGYTKELSVNVVPFIAQEVVCFDFRKYQIGNEIVPADDGSMGSKIDLLIGNDFYCLFVKDKRLLLDENLYLLETEFGWVCSGQFKVQNENNMSVMTYMQAHLAENLGWTSPDAPLKEGGIKQLWDLETLGIKDSPKCSVEEEAVRQFNDSILFKEGRYFVRWPWANFTGNLPSNYGLAMGRLQSLVKRTSLATLEKYDEILREQEKSGIIERVEDHLSTCNRPVHYLPHHHVTKEEGTTKLRIVLDGSARPNGEYQSLNEVLYKGPQLLEDLVGLMLRFRQNKVAVTADIERAFLQLGLQNEDRDVTRLLWLENYLKGFTQENIICFRFCRVPFGIISSPFLLNATIKFHLQKYKDSVLDRVAKNIYVDNLVISEETTEDAKNMYVKTKKAFDDISMNIRQWNSNNQTFTQGISKSQCEEKKITNVLGLQWNTKQDTLKLKINIENLEKAKENPTKRKVLSAVASIFDPCGFAAPTVLQAKIFIQELWKAKYQWDTILPKDVAEKWIYILDNLRDLLFLELPRYTGMMNNSTKPKYELHCFTDSSLQSYAAVVYLKTIYPDAVKISFIMAKSRLVSFKDQDDLKIPKLELLSCLIGTRLITYVKDNTELRVNMYLWSDSQIAINWIKSNKLLHPFVSRRVEEIKKHKDIEILYVESENNPADIATRPIKHRREENWLQGPNFLYEKDNYTDNWSLTQNLCGGEGRSITEEIEANNETRNTEKRNNLEEIQNEDKECEVAMTEIDQIQEVQRRHFPQECEGKQTCFSRSLGLFKDADGTLRCRGRMTYAAWTYDKKYPILLPKNSLFTEKVIRECHRNNYHVGATQTLSLVRQRFWVPQGHAKVKSILRKCPECKKHGGGPYKLPDLAPLPQERINYRKPFSYLGLDYLGHLMVTTDTGTIEKRWICLYTCLAVRAVHLEVVDDLTAEQCLLALRRFMATRGIPILITSDNALQFKLTAEVLQGPFCTQKKIQWRFIPELAPWHGGFYERLVGLVKNCLKRTVDKHLINSTQLCTIIKEIESVLNNRPLTYVGDEHDHILRPSDFLCLNECIVLPSDEPYLNTGDTPIKTALIEGWKRGRMIIDEFIKMFVNQYLLELRNRKQYKHKQHRIVAHEVPKVGEMVQIQGDNSNNRSLWKTGKITQLIKSKDGQTRVARVRVGDQEFTRSIGHLYPLEISEDEELDTQTDEIGYSRVGEVRETSISEQPTEVGDTEEDLGSENKVRKRREAAKRASEKLRRWTRLLLE